jgi:NADH:ubiquinone oxidoreductase subunit 6 (subunit J)
MNSQTTLFGATLLAVFAGLGLVLGGEWIHMRPLVYVGGVVVLGAVGVMTTALMRMRDPEPGEPSH